jgi:hypothetical protein
MTLSGIREDCCVLNYGAGLVPEPAVQLQKTFRCSFCKGIAAKYNDDNDLTSRIVYMVPGWLLSWGIIKAGRFCITKKLSR